MAGVRLHHETWNNCRVALSHPTLKLKPKYGPDGKREGCFACGGVVHERKTVHLDFDSNGYTFVSFEVLKLLQEAGLSTFGLTIMNEVEEPPAQVVLLAGAPVSFTADSVDKHEIRDKLRVFKNRILRPSFRPEEG